ncbi:MAG: T9SS type A sorting domain-containing protein [Bacteroidota bacterium]
MKERLLTLLFLGMCILAHSQNEANIWIAGEDFGFDFNFGRFQSFDRPEFKEEAFQTTASICDPVTGELLFFFHENRVWNRSFSLMPNGDDIMSGSSFGQQALIVPHPNNRNRFYLFTVISIAQIDGSIFPDNGLYYSLIDMRLNGGLGNVVSGTKNTLLISNPIEALTGTLHANGRDFWIITREYDSNRFVVFRLSNEGILSPSFQPFGLVYRPFPTGSASGMLQFSPDGRCLAFRFDISGQPFDSAGNPVELSPLELYDFDAATGMISNRRVLGIFFGYPSIAFSPDNTKLYYADLHGNHSQFTEHLRQYNLTGKSTQEIINSRDTLVWTYSPAFDNPSLLFPIRFHKLQLAPDGRLYNGWSGVMRDDETDSLIKRVIFYLDNPNEPLMNAKPSFRFLNSPNNIDPFAGTNVLDFPNFMQYYFNGLEPRPEGPTANECANMDVTLYPNPTKGPLYIETEIQNCLYPAAVSIYSMAGQELLKEQLIREGPFPTIDLSSYADGVYFLKLETFQKMQLKRIIKKSNTQQP